jgi:DNA-binding beta-propeller fold protein YncE
MLRTAVAAAFVLLSAATPVLAEDASERSYTYDESRRPVASPAGYEAFAKIFGQDLGVGPLNAPADLFITKAGVVYLLDSGNGRVVVFDSSLSEGRSIDVFTLDGQPSPLASPSGIHVTDDGTLIIADTGNSRIVYCRPDGSIQKEIGKPLSELYPQAAEFRPLRIVQDESGILYVVCMSIYDGAVLFDDSGGFMGFFGGNRVEVSLKLLSDRFWKSIFSTQNREKFSNYIPVEHTSLDVDDENMIYTVTANASSNANIIRKLNSMGINTIEQNVGNSFQGGFGDLNPTIVKRQVVKSGLRDISVDRNGFMTCIDGTRGRVFQYDTEANLLFVFGGIGSQLGLFINPSAVESFEDRIFVLDKSTNALTVFRRTTFGNKVQEATMLYNEGFYQESMTPWNDVLRMDSNFGLAYIGIGKAQLQSEDFQAAMQNFRIAGYVAGYDEAYGEYRTQRMRSGFTFFAVLALLLAAAFLAFRIPRLRQAVAVPLDRFRASPSAVRVRRALLPFRHAAGILTHPIDGYADLFHRRQQSPMAAAVLSLVFFAAVIVRRQLSGFLFNAHTRTNEINLPYLFVQSAGLLLVFSVVNWALCTLFDGKGRVKDIFSAVAYASQPYVLCLFAATALSNVLRRDEGVFIEYLVLLGQLYSLLLLVKGIEAVHQYTLPQTLTAIVTSVVGILVLLILFILALTLVQQIVGFVTTVYREYTINFT